MFAGPQICPGCQSQRTLSHGPGNLPGSPGDPLPGEAGGGQGEPWAPCPLPPPFPSPLSCPGSWELPVADHASLPPHISPVSARLHLIPALPPACLSLCLPVTPPLTSSSLSILPPCLCSPLLPSLPPSSPSSIHPSTHPPMDLFLRPLAYPSFLPCIHPSATPPTHSSIIHPFINTCNQPTLPATLSVKH